MNGEKVDLVLYSEDPADKNEAFVVVSDDDLSLAIGKKGANIKLASKLTKYHLTIKSMSQVNEEGNSDES